METITERIDMFLTEEKIFRIGLVWIGNGKTIDVVKIKASTEKDALNRAVSHFKPNHMQTLTVL